MKAEGVLFVVVALTVFKIFRVKTTLKLVVMSIGPLILYLALYASSVALQVSFDFSITTKIILIYMLSWVVSAGLCFIFGLLPFDKIVLFSKNRLFKSYKNLFISKGVLPAPSFEIFLLLFSFWVVVLLLPFEMFLRFVFTGHLTMKDGSKRI